jgi:hypothetical protein
MEHKVWDMRHTLPIRGFTTSSDDTACGQSDHLFSVVFVRMGDLVQVSDSHQAALTAVLSERASWRGLKVKIFGRDVADRDDFPSCLHFHCQKALRKRL